MPFLYLAHKEMHLINKMTCINILWEVAFACSILLRFFSPFVLSRCYPACLNSFTYWLNLHWVFKILILIFITKVRGSRLKVGLPFCLGWRRVERQGRWVNELVSSPSCVHGGSAGIGQASALPRALTRCSAQEGTDVSAPEVNKMDNVSVYTCQKKAKHSTDFIFQEKCSLCFVVTGEYDCMGVWIFNFL